MAAQIDQFSMDNISQKSTKSDAESDHIEDKDVNLGLMSFHAMITNFVGAGIIPVYTTFAEMFNTSVQNISYFTSIHILFTGLAPFFIVPISRRLGRRPVWIISTLCTAVCNIGCAKSSSYGAMLACRILGSIFISAPIALGPPVVVEMYSEHERGLKMGIWTLLATLGPPVVPFIMGFVAQRVGWQWIYWTFAIVSGGQCVLYFFFSPETRYISAPNQSTTGQKWTRQYLTLHRIDPIAFTVTEMFRPFMMAKYATVLIPIYAHSMIFNLTAAMVTVEIPQLFAARFGFNSEQIGLQFLGIIIGTLVGEGFNAVLHMVLMKRALKHGNGPIKIEDYLNASYFGFVCVIVGLVVFCLFLNKTKPMHYSVSPVIGIGVAGFGNQLVSNFLINYVMRRDSENAALVSVLLGFIRQTWCFIGPFWFPSMFATLGLPGTAGLLVGLVVISVLPLVWMQWKYRHV